MRVSSDALRISSPNTSASGLPYRVFHIDSYLADEIDRALCREFPTEILLRQIGDRLALNIDLVSDSDELHSFLKNSEVWRSYLAAWRSGDQLRNLVNSFYPELRARHIIPWRIFLARRLKRYGNLEITVLLSIYRRGFYLAPHSDDRHKLISLIHYLPVDEARSNGRGGTIFYTPRPNTRRRHLRQYSQWSRGIRKYFPIWLSPLVEASLKRRYLATDPIDAAEKATFDERFEQALDVEYRKNRICGFIKNDWSMHAVDLTEFPTDEIRRAVLINVRMRPSRMTKAVDRIEAVAAQLKRMTLRPLRRRPQPTSPEIRRPE